MAFEQLQNEHLTTRQLFEDAFERLPRVPYQPAWQDARSESYAAAVLSAKITHPQASVDPQTKRRIVLIPTQQLGVLVMHDKWGGRQEAPLMAAHPEGFDMIDFPLEMMAISDEAVASQFANTGKVVFSDALAPIFDAILTEVLTGQGAGRILNA